MEEEFHQQGFNSFQDTGSLLYNPPDLQNDFDNQFILQLKQEEENPGYLNENDAQDQKQFLQHQVQYSPYFDNQDNANNDANTQKRSRASGEVLALLIGEFNKNTNPNAQTRKRISEQTGMPERSVRIWFQNRRAKSRKLEKAQVNDKDEPYTYDDQVFGTSRYDNIPFTLNNNYYFIDAKSLTVGSWKRLKSGNLSGENILSVKKLSNLSPFSINDIMTNSTDLMIVISKKNFEINYFFSAITDNSKILFRIFFPISSVSNCSLSITTDENDNEKEQSCQLKLYLNRPPKFAVSFTNLIGENNNQWSICDDFSEGHQVNDAFVNGSGIPHVFVGLEQSLRFMNSFILDYNSSNVQTQGFSLPQRYSSKSPTHYPNTSPQNQVIFDESINQNQFPTSEQPVPTTSIPFQEASSNQSQGVTGDFGQTQLYQQFVSDDLTSNNNDTFDNYIQPNQDEQILDLDNEEIDHSLDINRAAF